MGHPVPLVASSLLDVLRKHSVPCDMPDLQAGKGKKKPKGVATGTLQGTTLDIGKAQLITKTNLSGFLSSRRLNVQNMN